MTFNEWMNQQEKHYDRRKRSKNPDDWYFADFVLEAVDDPQGPQDEVYRKADYLEEYRYAGWEAKRGCWVAWCTYLEEERPGVHPMPRPSDLYREPDVVAIVAPVRKPLV